MLPDPNSEWPPKPLSRVAFDISRWGAWWSGDPDALSGAYRAFDRHPEQESWRSQGGLMGAVQRWFWGSKPRPGEPLTKLHVPVAAEIAQVSADLIFGQPPTVTVEDDDATQERLDALIGDRGQIQLYEAAETCAALGHVYLRVGWDRDIDPTGPLLSVIDADAALPVYSYGHLREVTFVREWFNGGSVLRHLELHEPGMIWHAAYMGDLYNIGRQVPLSAHPETADIADANMIADPDRLGSGIETGIDRLDVVGVANQRSKTWRHLPAARDLGVPDISGVEQSLDALDSVWTSWMRDIRHGRSRIHVPMHMMTNNGLGKGAQFDLDRELYVGLESPPDGPLQLEATQFKIRYEEHAATALALLERIVGGAGYSLQTFGLDTSRSTQTATESWARQNRTQNTRNGKLRHWDRAVRDLSYILLAVDRVQFGGQGNPDLDVTVQFADTVSDAQLTRAQTATMLRSAEAASTKTLVELVHNDWDAEQVEAEVEAIKADLQPPPMRPPGDVPSQFDKGIPPGGTDLTTGHTGLDTSANLDG